MSNKDAPADLLHQIFQTFTFSRKLGHFRLALPLVLTAPLYVWLFLIVSLFFGSVLCLFTFALVVVRDSL